eukprot:1157366-Pelagomonas_calceolata.AAC.8
MPGPDCGHLKNDNFRACGKVGFHMQEQRAAWEWKKGLLREHAGHSIIDAEGVQCSRKSRVLMGRFCRGHDTHTIQRQHETCEGGASRGGTPPHSGQWEGTKR